MSQQEHADNEVEVIESFAGGAITIEKEYDLEKQEELQFVNVLGVRIKRRNPEKDGLPGTNLTKENFSDITLGNPEVELLQMAMMRHAIGHHVLFLGPSGYGKSTMPMLMAFLLNITCDRVDCTKGMNVHKQFLWSVVRDNGSVTGRHGPLPRTKENGGIMIINELPKLTPEE